MFLQLKFFLAQGCVGSISPEDRFQGVLALPVSATSRGLPALAGACRPPDAATEPCALMALVFAANLDESDLRRRKRDRWGQRTCPMEAAEMHVA